MSNHMSLIDCLENIDDPRRRLNADCHPLINVLFIGISAVICGADDYCMIARFGKERKSWLEKYLDLSNGVPAHDTFNRVFESIKPEQFESALPEGLADCERWAGMKAIGIAISNVEREGKFHVETRYYILSKLLSGEQFGRAVRTHWSIENQLHWQLDVSFGEDQIRIRKKHGAANFNQLRKTASSLLKNETSVKLGIKNKRVTPALSSDYLAKVLGIK